MKFKIVGIGEVLWDLLPGGRQLGGAPANFAGHAQALGADACVITRIGHDPLGNDILRFLEKWGGPGNTVQVDPKAPTGTVEVTLSGDGIPRFIIHENVAWDFLESTPDALKAARAAEVICFGTVAQRREPARSSIQSLVAATRKEAWRIFDINLRQNYFSREVIEQSLRLANVLKLNDGELETLAGMFDLTGSTRDQIERLAGEFQLSLVALTRGPLGGALFRGGQWSDCSPAPVKIVDTVGAGDAFTAALALGLLRKMELEPMNRAANEVAGYVCSHAGATPPLPRKFSELFSDRADVA